MNKVFRCRLCGETCCYFKDIYESPIVFPWEMKKLLEKRNDLLFKPYIVYRVRGNNYTVLLYRWIIKGKCPFLGDNGLCIINEDKPNACKMFPLIIGIDDNTLRVSNACPYVEELIKEYEAINPAIVFPNEYPVALETYMLIKLVDEIASINDWEKIIIKNEEMIGSDWNYIELEELIELDEIRSSIKGYLIKYSQKQP